MRCHYFLIAISTLAFSILPTEASALQEPIVPLARAHAHNDYNHPRPLLDALENGFCSVEADIFLVDGELRVGHDRSELKPGKTLEKLYLEPLRQWIAENDGQIFVGNQTQFTLLIDVAPFASRQSSRRCGFVFVCR